MKITCNNELLKMLAIKLELKKINLNESMFTVDVGHYKIIICPSCNGKSRACMLCDGKKLVLASIWHMYRSYMRVATSGMDNRRFM